VCGRVLEEPLRARGSATCARVGAVINYHVIVRVALGSCVRLCLCLVLGLCAAGCLRAAGVSAIGVRQSVNARMCDMCTAPFTVPGLLEQWAIGRAVRIVEPVSIGRDVVMHCFRCRCRRA
jgi:hypothetical protein